MKHFRLLAVLLLSFPVGWLLLSTRPAAASSRFEPTANNATYISTPTTVYKNTNFTLVDGVRFYSKFENLDSYVREATAYVYFYSVSGSETVNVYEVTSEYDPDTLVWNTQPTQGALITSFSVTAVGWYSFDITDHTNNHYGGNMAFLLSGSTSTSGSVVPRALPASDHIYIDYIPAVLEKPQEPNHCWGFDDTQDSFGNNHLTLNNSATVGSEVGVVDSGLGLPSAFFSNGSFISPYTAASDTTVAFWLNAPSSLEVSVGTAGSDGWAVKAIPGNYFQVYSDGSSVNLGTADYSHFVAVSWSTGGVITLTVDTVTYTDTLALPSPSSDTFQILGDNGAMVDQLMIFNSVLSSENIAWLYRGGMGRSCAEWTPTSVTLLIPTPQYQVALPSGGVGDVSMSATAGEIGIMFALFVLCAITGFTVLQRWSSETTGEHKSGSD